MGKTLNPDLLKTQVNRYFLKLRGKKKSRNVHISTLLPGTDIDTKTNTKRESEMVARLQELVWHSRGLFKFFSQ